MVEQSRTASDTSWREQPGVRHTTGRDRCPGRAVVMTEMNAHERTCLELAWRSCRAGTIGVGAVLVDVNGQAVAKGNNAIFADADAGPLAGSRIAHAEMNVFAQVRPGDGLEGATLYTSLEPCAMCAGAILMHDLAAVRVLARDHLMHNLDAMGDRNEWVRKHWAPREFATDEAVVRYASLFATHAIFFWSGTSHDLVAKMTAAEPALASWIGSVVSEGTLTELAAANATLDDVIEALG